MSRAILVTLLLAGCAHESLWRIEVDGTLYKDGVELERFFGRDIDSGYRSGDTPELYVHDWKVSGDIRYDLEFRLEDHRVLEDIAVGTYGERGSTDPGSSERQAVTYHPGSPEDLGLVSMGEKEDGDYGPDHDLEDIVFEIKENRDGKIFGVFTGTFSDGLELRDAEFVMTGFGDPRSAKPDDDDTYGTYGYGGGCYSFSDTTPYYNDGQADPLCWSAGLYDACGDTSARDTTCATLDQLLSSGTGSLSTCPYC